MTQAKHEPAFVHSAPPSGEVASPAPLSDECAIEGSARPARLSHTPGPWAIGETRAKEQEVLISVSHPDPRLGYTRWDGLAVAYGCDDNRTVGAEVAMANARHIVQCVNSHDELLAAAKLASTVIREYIGGDAGLAACKQIDAAIERATS